MTEEQFNQLPLLLTRSDLYQCGLCDKAISHLVSKGTLTSFRARERGYNKYYKHEVAKILGMGIKGQRKVGAANEGKK